VVRGLNTPKCSLCSRGDVQRSLPVSGSRPESGVGQPLETTRRTRPRIARSYERCSRFKGVACGTTVPDSVTRLGRQDRVFTVPGQQQQQYYQLLHTTVRQMSLHVHFGAMWMCPVVGLELTLLDQQTKPLPQTARVPSSWDAKTLSFLRRG
jgi:hypothetical protein